MLICMLIKIGANIQIQSVMLAALSISPSHNRNKQTFHFLYNTFRYVLLFTSHTIASLFIYFNRLVDIFSLLLKILVSVTLITETKNKVSQKNKLHVFYKVVLNE